MVVARGMVSEAAGTEETKKKPRHIEEKALVV